MFKIHKTVAALFFASTFVGLASAETINQNAEAAPLSFKVCGARYQEAKKAGELRGRTWIEFRRTDCGIRGGQGAVTIGPRSEATSAEALRRVSFPSQLAGEFHDRKPAQQRMRTCLKSYHANKEAGTLAGLRWVQRGGGYYSLCTARLKASEA